MMNAAERRRRLRERVELGLFCVFFFFLLWARAEAKCSRACDSVASFYITEGENLTYIAQLFNIPVKDRHSMILPYNPQVTNGDNILTGDRLNIPFSCNCLNDDILAHKFINTLRSQDTYFSIANATYKNLTTVDDLRKFNSYSDSAIPTNVALNVTVNCSCGDSSISKDYGYFLTYPVRPDENMADVLVKLGAPSIELVERYNQGKNLSSWQGLVFIPIKGIPAGVIVGISIAVVVVVPLMGLCLYFGAYRRKKWTKASVLPSTHKDNSIQAKQGAVSNLDGTTESSTLVGGVSSTGTTGNTVYKSLEFSYEELAKATNDFSMANKIGEGGFGAVFYAELRGEKAAIKKMDMQASKEFWAELKVLTHVRHLNLVYLIGYCTENSLFLVYEFIENGNLSQHLHGSVWEPLLWSTRVQIALDSARGLEYIHEHTVPAYIHRDIKSSNILIDKNFHGKVADFGLTKLAKVGSTSLQTNLAGTFGYMPPEYARSGKVSPKVDVYAFGVVLYELISAKKAIVQMDGSDAEPKGLVALFEGVLNATDPLEDLRKLVDPRLGDSYPIDSVHKMAQLAEACTHENPQLRPSMRTVVVALMALSSSSSSSDNLDVGSFYENQALGNIMSER
ncbi:Pkinase domain-containing protein/LysM domain-containing protein [Cinnamomum micranthum f. kanehirae]|uniref:non-specific serine/threonine protein kinase n=1 Tax=Cinnamomum micranthum f. kanehirae TaxID=337451 RepID=A0A3S3MD27_9MAGN|nr:Pkinase domain-containing protein/LysM domain-containing protein [Cinnamomum micranthum f. kanehirae]